MGAAASGRIRGKNGGGRKANYDQLTYARARDIVDRLRDNRIKSGIIARNDAEANGQTGGGRAIRGP